MSKIKKKIMLILAFCLISIGSLNWALPICYSASIDSRNILTDEQTARKDSNQSGRYQYWEVSFNNRYLEEGDSILLGPYKIIVLDDRSKLILSNITTLRRDGSLCKYPECDHHSEMCPFWISPDVQHVRVMDYGNRVYIVLECKEKRTLIEGIINCKHDFCAFFFKKQMSQH